MATETEYQEFELFHFVLLCFEKLMRQIKRGNLPPKKSKIRLLKRAFDTQTISLEVADSPQSKLDSKGKDTHHGKRYPLWLEVKRNSK